MADIKDLVIRQGETFSHVVRWEVEPIIYKAISAISKTAPVSITSTAHGIPDGWRVAVVSVKGMTEINAKNKPPRVSDLKRVTVTGVNTIELNDVNSSEFTAYASGGYLQFHTPADLTGYTARMSIKDRIGGTVLLSLTTENNRIAIDDTGRKITLTVNAVTTAAITWLSGVYDLELESPLGVVTTILNGSIEVTKEVTTT